MGLINQMMTNLYKPPKQEKAPTVLPKNLTPAKMASLMNQTSVSQGQFLKGQVLDLRANQIMVLLENGITVSARTEGTLNLSIGENARFFVAQTTEDQILLKLAKEDTPAENPMIDKALTAANVTKTERSVSIVTELLNHQQPVNETSIRHFLSLSAKYPELPVKDLVLMELHHIPVTKENVDQFVAYQDRNAKLLTQAQDMLQTLADSLEQLPEGTVKQELLKELQQMLGKEGSATASPQAEPQTTSTQNATATPPAQVSSNTDGLMTPSEYPLEPETEAAAQNILQETAGATATDAAGTQNYNTPEAATDMAKQSAELPDASSHILQELSSRTEGEAMIKDFFDSFLLKPEDVADPDKVQDYYDELNEKLEKLEQLSQKIAEHTTENHTTDTPKQMRQNLSFMEAVNNVFPYIQLPLKFRESPAHGELYVYERKKSLKQSDSLSALLHLELEALGTTDIYVTLAGTHVTTRFSMTDKDSGNLIRSEMPKLSEALAVKGYTLQSEVAVREPSEENTPTLLEQFLEEHAPGGLNRYTFDIRA